VVGVSRVGKTPLSMYLSVLGWKVANVPLVLEIEPAVELFKLNPQRVFGLAVDAGQLLAHRLQRQQRLGVSGPSDYIDPDSITLELKFAANIFQRSGFNVIDVTDKPIESTADEIIRQVTRLSE
jgi:[pyruvate, water dikinase]-phosphate phosphotransferase / [pyruvate, water dikinase] kinase